MRRGKKMSETIGQILLWVFLIAALLIFSVPFIFMITNSFEEFSYVLPYPRSSCPTGWTSPPTRTSWAWTSSRRR